ncbi:hypothetical protein [uncultured Brevundimonas sp.]|uniref:hypothetical protein n=1 Tax=uncultured Brevundimonas sp. TaxID=213418 RepID=UPI0026212779|nr:hypothetical protein [uncultured Brevundimonas sp.]
MTEALRIDTGYLPVDIWLVRTLEEWRGLTEDGWPDFSAKGFTATILNKEGKQAVALYIDRKAHKTKSDFAMTVVHECVHVFQHVCTIISEDRPSGEFEAYSIMHYFGQVMEAA